MKEKLIIRFLKVGGLLYLVPKMAKCLTQIIHEEEKIVFGLFRDRQLFIMNSVQILKIYPFYAVKGVTTFRFEII